MAYRLEDKMVIGISSRALFDLSAENEIFEKQGVEAYCRYQVEHEKEILKPGPGFGLVKELLRLNEHALDGEFVEVIIMSRNSPDTSLRVFNAIKYYGLKITRAVLVSGASLAPYLSAFHTDLFLSAYEDDVQSAIDSGIAAGIICTDHVYTDMAGENAEHGGFLGNLVQFPQALQMAYAMDKEKEDRQIRIAFDGDAVLFTDESEKIFKEKGLEAFEENEALNAGNPLEEGPFANFLRKLSDLQRKIGTENCPIRTALVTSRSAPAHERVIRTLRAWNVRVDEAFFLGGIEKKEFLRAFGAQIFFDDQSVHTVSASQAVPAARVPYRRIKRRVGLTDEVSAYCTG
ncbi:MAG: 5'-nucleotidase [Bacteroidales bacterium]|nr:5'-nucleotidase [Lachnoclostridium sp.]MCM1383646.1 5'-nucleotidase [Lachnoclostridium sp.]MCM1465727.1 5'-nucleotidase [Bacteroidales bacterium]